LENNNSYDNADVIEDNFEDYSEKNSDLNFPPNWVRGSWENQPYPCNVILSDPPISPYTPLQYFKQIFDTNIIQNIVYQTNLYSVQKNGTSINTNTNEIEIFLGIHMVMSIVKMPTMRMYWANNSKYTAISDAMARNRFENLRANIHFNDNTYCLPNNHPNHDKLFKIRPYIDAIQNNFKMIAPEEFTAIDEIIIPFKGRSVMKQYNKSKPHKWGIKMFALASKSGIIHDFEIYVGKSTIKSSTKMGLSGDIVIRLSDILPKHKNYKLSFDNWFTSYNLILHLKSLGILSVGTVRSNRIAGCQFENDKDLKKAGRGTYDTRIDTSHGIIGCKWYDNKSVHLISNYIGTEPTDPVLRWSASEKAQIPVKRPAMVREYNSFMGGIDLHDMLVEIYRTDIKCKRYYMRIVFHIMDMCIVNSWLMYRRHCKQLNIPKYNSLLIFKTEIAQGLLSSGKGKLKRSKLNLQTPPSRRKYTNKPVPDVRFDKYEHWPEYIQNKKRCKYCPSNPYSRTQCAKCEVALCYNSNRNCFRHYHEK